VWQPMPGLPTNPRWRCPDVKPMALNAAVKIGPPPRSFADDAHDCIMVRSAKQIDRIQGCGATSVPPMASSPSDHVVPIIGERRASTKQQQRRMTFVRRGDKL
ncbi:MAG TPA: hypothetical protein VGM32_09055, partial [Rhodopila sp.]